MADPPRALVSGATFAEYLAAKRTLDDRSLNSRVLGELYRALPEPLDLLDVGCGLGATLSRLIDDGAALPSTGPRQWRYTGIDREPELIGQAVAAVREQLRHGGWRVASDGVAQDGIRAQRAEHDLEIRLHASGLENVLGASGGRQWNVIASQAFLDLVDLDPTLDALLAIAAPGALFYGALCFDGLTVIGPEIEQDLDDRMVEVYHRHMYAERWGGSAGQARTGRRLLDALIGRGLSILDAGASDWVIVPRQGRYSSDERVVLRFLLTHLGRVVESSGELEPAVVQPWLRARLRQIDQGVLTYIAHQLDVLARLPG